MLGTSARAFAQPDVPAPATATAALDRASAAYEYGEMKEVVEFTRPVVEGAMPATPVEREKALRLLGIGLYLTGRTGGAGTQFLDLLRLNPRARLDPTTTRPEVVAFFEEVRRRHAGEIADAARARRSLAWNFLPPVGQFQNGDPRRGYAILGLEVASLIGAISTKVTLDRQRKDGADTSPSVRSLRAMNWVSVGLLAGTYVYGVVDGFLRADNQSDEPESALSVVVFPTGGGLHLRF